MNQEKIKVLQLLEDGKINSAEAMELLNTLESSREDNQPIKTTSSSKDRTLRVRIDGNKTKVNVNIPLNLVRVASQIAGFGMQWIPDEAHEQMKKQGIDLAKIDFNELMQLIDQGLSDGRLVDLVTEDEKEGKMKVEVYVE
jgi:hypothetical protein